MSVSTRGRRRAPGYAALLAGAAIVSLSVSAAAETVSLEEALSRAAAGDPAIAAYEARMEAARAGVRQAGMRPTPRLGVDLENFAGTGRLGLADETETTLYYEQTLERGSKREARADVARSAIDLTEARAAVRALDLLEQVQAAWVRAQAAAQRIETAAARLDAVQRFEADVSRRVAAALDPRFTAQRAGTDVAQARIALDRARAEAEGARALLAAYWGGGAAFDLPPLAEPSPTVAFAAETPDEQLLVVERDAAEARIALERSRSSQDPTLRGGVRYLAAGDAAALVVGASIPLGSRAANRGAVEQAIAERAAAAAELNVARIAREREIARLTARQAAAAAEIRALEQEVLPGAQRAADSARDGFNRGGTAFTFLDVIEAERAVFEARSRRIDLLEEFHMDGARLDRLGARHLSLIALAEVQP